MESSFESCALECMRDKFTFDPYVFPASARQQAFHLALQIFHWSARTFCLIPDPKEMAVMEKQHCAFTFVLLFS